MIGSDKEIPQRRRAQKDSWRDLEFTFASPDDHYNKFTLRFLPP